MIDRSLFADNCAIVLEDDPRVRERLIASLAQLGLTAEPLPTIDAARDLLDRNPPDLIVLSRHVGGEDTL
jgi:DNA-binding response OmpR family regulator